MSLATATIPIVNDVRGEIAFDDLFALTTPPGQALTIGELNPGIAVSEGQVRFQLLDESRVSIERAEFAFASGHLAMTPTTIILGADETQFELTLRDVDAADLLQTLNVPDVTATGQLEGHFPLLLTRRSAFINGGVLRSQGDGGVLSCSAITPDTPPLSPTDPKAVAITEPAKMAAMASNPQNTKPKIARNFAHFAVSRK